MSSIFWRKLFLVSNLEFYTSQNNEVYRQNKGISQTSGDKIFTSYAPFLRMLLESILKKNKIGNKSWKVQGSKTLKSQREISGWQLSRRPKEWFIQIVNKRMEWSSKKLNRQIWQYGKILWGAWESYWNIWGKKWNNK